MKLGADIIIQDILELERMTIRKLASVTKIKSSTMARLLSGDEVSGESSAYLKLVRYKSKLMENRHPEK